MVWLSFFLKMSDFTNADIFFLIFAALFRGVFRIVSNIYDGGFFKKLEIALSGFKIINSWKSSIKVICQNSTYHSLKQPPVVFCEKCVLRYFAKFTGKHLCQSLFFNQRRPWHRCVLVNFATFLRKPFFYRTHPVAASICCYFQFDMMLWKRLTLL